MHYRCHTVIAFKCRTEIYIFPKKSLCYGRCITHSAMINPNPSKPQYCVWACVKTSSGPPSFPFFLKSTVGRGRGGAPLYQCVCCECENICKCAARLSNGGTAWNPSRADTWGREVVSAAQALAAGEVTFIKSCQRLEIRSAIFNPASVCVYACICMFVFTWVWDETSRSYRGRNIIYCAASSGGSEGMKPFFFPIFFLPLFIQSWLTKHTPANPCVTHIQSNIFVAGYKHSYVVATKQL